MPNAGPAPSDTRLSSGPLAVGALVLDGRFRVTSLLGGGGMGMVYRGEQVSLGRPVALKVLREDLSQQAGMAERFRREALLLSAVDSPSVVRIIDFGVHEGLLCLVMELIEGRTLELALREGPFAPARALQVLEQLARGLAVIHAQGIVHRDLKPENVLLCDTPAGETARLLDFGIARFADQSAPGSGVTQAGLVLGTPEYLSPEQAMGQGPASQSDLYSLGVLAYRMLSGRLPFSGSGPGELIAQHVHAAPTPLLEVAPALSSEPALAALVMQCLEKDPASRPQGAAVLADAFAALRGRATGVGTLELPVASPVKATGALQRFTTGAQTALASPARRLQAGALAAVVLLGGLGLAWRASSPERRARALLEAGRGGEALQRIDDAGDEGKDPTLMQLRAAALHQVNRHDEELELFARVPTTGPLEPLSVHALADDYGRRESAAARRALTSWPKAVVLKQLQALANESPDKGQWGALRLVDQEWAGQGLDLVSLYATALEQSDCQVRRTAARRLSELPAAGALKALRALKDTPKKKGGGFFSDDDCGQDAAAAAMRKLEKELPP
ncbi:MAG: serine/threonine protein kinase [Myxococcaceae bacterium]|nr:serine/threonine protein kinase [Myxococcaceae bacterium]